MPKPRSALSTSMPMPSVNSPLPSGIMVMFWDSWSFDHSFITKVSFTDTHRMASTPCLANTGASSL
ncbi:hypothetical protein D3C87_1634270 [compost metagenome]